MCSIIVLFLRLTVQQAFLLFVHFVVKWIFDNHPKHTVDLHKFVNICFLDEHNYGNCINSWGYQLF